MEARMARKRKTAAGQLSLPFDTAKESTASRKKTAKSSKKAHTREKTVNKATKTATSTKTKKKRRKSAPKHI